LVYHNPLPWCAWHGHTTAASNNRQTEKTIVEGNPCARLGSGGPGASLH